MKKGFLGQYTYIAMTKVDVYEHGESDYKATAVHEYIHSFLVRSTLYGHFMQGLERVNLIDKKHEKIINKLYSNEERLQETSATLIELLYVWYKDGLNIAKSHLRNLPDPYKKYVRKYEHIFNNEYISEIYNQYLRYIENEIKNENNPELVEGIEKFKKELNDDTTEKTALNLITFLIIRVSQLALTVDLKEINEELWNTEKKITRYICNQNADKYHPNGRFDKYMKHIFTVEITEKNNRFNLEEIVYIPSNPKEFELYNVSDFILNKFNENVEKQKIIENTLNEYINTEIPNLSTVSKLETEALIYALPYMLNEESIEKFFGKNYWVDYGKINKEGISFFIEKEKIIQIHPTTGSRDKYAYEVCFNTIVNRDILRFLQNPEHKKDYHNSNKVLEIKCRIERLEDLIELLSKFDGTIYLTGCQRSIDLIEALQKQNKDRMILINSVASLTSSVSFINEYFDNANSMIINSKYCDILLIENKNKVFIQYLLPSVKEMVSKLIAENRLLIKNIPTIFDDSYYPSYWGLVEKYTDMFYRQSCTYIAIKKGFNLEEQLNYS